MSKGTEFNFTQKEATDTESSTQINLVSTDGASCSTTNDDISSSSNGISGGAIAGVVIGSIVIAGVVAAIIAVAVKSSAIAVGGGAVVPSTTNEVISNVGTNTLSMDKMGTSV